jgi:hypothetical protein
MRFRAHLLGLCCSFPQNIGVFFSSLSSTREILELKTKYRQALFLCPRCMKQFHLFCMSPMVLEGVLEASITIEYISRSDRPLLLRHQVQPDNYSRLELRPEPSQEHSNFQTPLLLQPELMLAVVHGVASSQLAFVRILLASGACCLE